MFRLFCLSALFLLAVDFPSTSRAADEPSERVALFIADPEAPVGTCQFDEIAPALRELRFELLTASSGETSTIATSFAEVSARAEASMVFVCNPRNRAALPGLLKATALNFLFLLETSPAKRGSEFTGLVKTDRDDLVIIHARVDTPENEEIFSRTLAHKLRRPYSVPEDILSRTVVSSYYRSRGSMLIELQGRVSSGYILARPPTDQILDAWSRVQKSTNRKELEAFIAKFPTTLFADLARSRLEKLP